MRMQIFNKNVQRVNQVYNKLASVKETNKNKADQDKVTLSTEGKELQAILEKVHKTPQLSPKAQELKQAVSSGTYHINGEEIAASMIRYFEQKV